jgi:hypothetical protein
MKTVPLAKGKGVAIVDDEDYAAVSRFRWHLNEGYASRSTGIRPHRVMVRMHRLIAGPKVGQHVDHINRDKLDNRRVNLRTVSHQQNCWNSSARANSKTGVKGVSWRAEKKKYRAVIEHAGRQIFLGYHESVASARRARELKETELRGVFAPIA